MSSDLRMKKTISSALLTLLKNKDLEAITAADISLEANISKRTLQHYRDTGVLPFTQIGHKCYYKREDVETLLLTKSNKPKNRQI